MSTSDEDELRAAVEVLEDTFDLNRFVAACRASCRLVEPDMRKGSTLVADAALVALEVGRALSMVRIGDGESNLLSFARSPGPGEIASAKAIMQIHDGWTFEAADLSSVAADLSEAIRDADIVGIRPFGPLSPAQQVAAMRRNIATGDLRGARGMLDAYRGALRSLADGDFAGKILTSAWVHLGLRGQVEHLCARAARVVLVTGRRELELPFSRLLGEKLTFISVPLQASDMADGESRSRHFPTRYREVHERLDLDLTGALVLVGAGPFGKRYCAQAKKAGGVALDIGSGFDLIAGVKTRPVHDLPEFMA